MSPPTILVSATTLTAKFFELGQYLELHAEGDKPFVGPPQFIPVPWLGALKFRLAGAFIGIGVEGKQPPPETPYTADYKTKYTLVPSWNQDVLIETADGLKTVHIEIIPFTGPAPQANVGNVGDADNTIDVLPVITLAIEGPFSNDINAVVPQKQEGVKSTVHIDVNPEFVRILSTTAEDGIIKWVVAWNPDHYPTGEGENPQLIEVTTTKLWRVGTKVHSSRIIQPYHVSFVNLPIGRGKNVPINTKTV